MTRDARYKSGTSLERTKKEVNLDALDSYLGEFSLEMREALGRLNVQYLDELVKRISKLTLETTCDR